MTLAKRIEQPAKALVSGDGAVREFLKDYKGNHRFKVILDLILSTEVIPTSSGAVSLSKGLNSAEMTKDDILWVLDTRYEDDLEFYQECLEDTERRRKEIEELKKAGKLPKISADLKMYRTNATAHFQFVKGRSLRPISNLMITEDIGPTVTVDDIQNEQRQTTQQLLEAFLAQQKKDSLADKDEELKALKAEIEELKQLKSALTNSTQSKSTPSKSTSSKSTSSKQTKKR